MSDSFRALRLNKTDDGQSHEIIEMTEDALMDGDVTVAVSHSTLNYKDGLALTGEVPVVRAWPMIPGIDFAGEIATGGIRFYDRKRPFKCHQTSNLFDCPHHIPPFGVARGDRGTPLQAGAVYRQLPAAWQEQPTLNFCQG